LGVAGLVGLGALVLDVVAQVDHEVGPHLAVHPLDEGRGEIARPAGELAELPRVPRLRPEVQIGDETERDVHPFCELSTGLAEVDGAQAAPAGANDAGWARTPRMKGRAVAVVYALLFGGLLVHGVPSCTDSVAPPIPPMGYNQQVCLSI